MQGKGLAIMHQSMRTLSCGTERDRAVYVRVSRVARLREKEQPQMVVHKRYEKFDTPRK